MKCKRRLSIVRAAIGAGGSVELVVSADTVELLLRVVDATDAPQAFAVAVAGAESAAWHLAAGEAWSDRDLQLQQMLRLVVSGTPGHLAELARWEG